MKIVSAAVVAAVVLAGCSSRPREFTPQLAPPAAAAEGGAAFDAAAFDAAYESCRVAVASARRSRGSSAGAAAGAGAATAAAGSAAATTAGGYAGMAVLGATVVALPVVAIAGAWGMAKKKKVRKERRIKSATGACLAGSGYTVAAWQPAPRTVRDERRAERRTARARAK
jgi:hypothetical protein